MNLKDFRIKSNRLRILVVLGMTLSIGFFTGCQKDDEIPSEEESIDDPYISIMKDILDFDPSNIVKEGDTYFYDDCMAYTEADLDVINKNHRTAKYGKHTGWIRDAGTYYLDIDDNLHAGWRTAARQAADEWNALKSHVRFTDDDTETVLGTVTVTTKSDARNTNVATYYNSSTTIKVNINYDQTVSGVRHTYTNAPSGKKKWAMVHELGHFIGFPHVTEGTFLWTPDSDCNGLSQWDYSIMQGSKRPFLVSWNNTGQKFSKCDITAVDALYERAFIKSKLMNRFWCSENGNNGVSSIANRTHLGPWEKFEIEYNGDDDYSIKGSNGKYADVSTSSWKVKFDGNRDRNDTNWKLIKQGSGDSDFRIYNQRHNCYLDANYGSWTTCSPWSSSHNQVWKIRRLSECSVKNDCIPLWTP